MSSVSPTKVTRLEHLRMITGGFYSDFESVVRSCGRYMKYPLHPRHWDYSNAFSLDGSRPPTETEELLLTGFMEWTSKHIQGKKGERLDPRESSLHNFFRVTKTNDVIRRRSNIKAVAQTLRARLQDFSECTPQTLKVFDLFVDRVTNMFVP